MALKVLRRALLLFVALISLAAAAVGAIAWHHMRIVGPCPPDGLPNGQPVTCFYRVQALGDWWYAMGAIAVGFVACLLVSWLSFKRRRPVSGA